MTKVKICGMTRLEDAIFCCNIGVWALGFIFYPKSKRYISPDNAKKIINEIKKYNIKTIGVFVNENYEKINEIADLTEIDYIQMHGVEENSECLKLNKPFIKNIRNINEIDNYPTAVFYMTDAKDLKNWGGTGELSDWELAKKIKNKNKKLMLSGGLSKKNIEKAIFEVKPDFVDVSSGVETEPGIKDYKKIKDFFDKINNIGEKYE